MSFDLFTTYPASWPDLHVDRYVQQQVASLPKFTGVVFLPMFERKRIPWCFYLHVFATVPSCFKPASKSVLEVLWTRHPISPFPQPPTPHQPLTFPPTPPPPQNNHIIWSFVGNVVKCAVILLTRAQKLSNVHNIPETLYLWHLWEMTRA